MPRLAGLKAAMPPRICVLSTDILMVVGLHALVEEWGGARLVASETRTDRLSEMLHTSESEGVVVDVDSLWNNSLYAAAWLMDVRTHYPRLHLVVLSHRQPRFFLPPGVVFSHKGDMEGIRRALQVKVPPTVLPGAANKGVGALSSREIYVITALMAGQSVSEVASASHRSLKTVSAQKRSAMKKLGIRSLFELQAGQQGL